MPNYDGNGPLKRGRVIGRGLGPCHAKDRMADETGPETKAAGKKLQTNIGLRV